MRLTYSRSLSPERSVHESLCGHTSTPTWRKFWKVNSLLNLLCQKNMELTFENFYREAMPPHPPDSNNSEKSGPPPFHIATLAINWLVRIFYLASRAFSKVSSRVIHMVFRNELTFENAHYTHTYTSKYILQNIYFKTYTWKYHEEQTLHIHIHIHIHLHINLHKTYTYPYTSKYH